MAQVKVDPATHGPPSASAKHHQQLQFRVGPAVTQSALVAADLAPIWPAQALHQWQQRWPWAPFLYAGPTLQRLIRAPEHEHHGGSSSAVTRSRPAPQLWRGWHWRSIASLELADATLSVISPRLAAATMAPDWETALARVRAGLIQSLSQSPWPKVSACGVLEGIASISCLNPLLPQLILI
jgi:hypothetical protein